MDAAGIAIGWAQLEVRDTVDNRHLASFDIGVRPEHRRRGIGSQLLRRCAEGARDSGRTKLNGWASAASPGDCFLAASGGAFVFLARLSRCPVAGLDRDQLLEWSERRAGYTILTWDAPTPEDHVEAYARVLDVMNTAPLQDLDREAEVFTAELLRGRERVMLDRKGEKWVSVARHDQSGRIVGLSELFFDGFRSGRVGQGNTGVEPAHRGQGLGRALKAVNALRLLEERPGAEFIETFNQDGNADAGDQRRHGVPAPHPPPALPGAGGHSAGRWLAAAVRLLAVVGLLLGPELALHGALRHGRRGYPDGPVTSQR